MPRVKTDKYECDVATAILALEILMAELYFLIYEGENEAYSQSWQGERENPWGGLGKGKDSSPIKL